MLLPSAEEGCFPCSESEAVSVEGSEVYGRRESHRYFDRLGGDEVHFVGSRGLVTTLVGWVVVSGYPVEVDQDVVPEEGEVEHADESHASWEVSSASHGCGECDGVVAPV